MTGHNLNMADLRFHNNSAATGGAIATIGVPTAQIRRSRFAANFQPTPTHPPPTPTHPTPPAFAHTALIHPPPPSSHLHALF